MAKKMLLWKALRAGLKSQYDQSQWQIGEWRKLEEVTELCVGFNASPRIVDAIQYVDMEILARVEVRGQVINGGDKLTASQMRIVGAWCWPKAESVRLAIFAAELVLDNFEKSYPEDKRPREAIAAARAWMAQPSASAGSAASAAWSAAWSAESAAWSAESAARSAARSAGSAAWSAANSAAWSAGSAASAAWSAAKSAARSAGSAARSAARSAAWSAANSAACAARSAARSAESADCLSEIEIYIQSRIPELKPYLASEA